MDLPVHNQILWHACVEAERRLGVNKIGSPTACYPYLVCGSWMNDMNQSTIFTDFIANRDGTTERSYEAAGAIDAFFKVLWIEELRALLDRMQNGSPESKASAEAFMGLFPNALSEESTATASFGKYCRFDHLDVLESNAGSENASWNNSSRYVSKTVTQAVKYAKYSFVSSSFDYDAKERLSRDAIIALGRSLHTFADFYAHSNYVELLLWSLAFEDRLKPGVVNEFNNKGKFPRYSDKIHPYCPLPTKRDDVKRLIATSDDDNFFRVLWYGARPEATPLSSCRFLFTDTAYSLLTMYATHLERVSASPLDNHTLDLAMAVFNVPGRDVISRFFRIYEEAAGMLRTIGELARTFLASRLEDMGQRADATTRGMLEAAASIVRRYDHAEAGEWARAGRFKYIAYTLQKDMAAPLANQDFNTPILPHHSLLCKDYLPGFPGDILRFRLACLFATEVTTELLMMHFSKNAPKEEAYWEVASRYFLHPSQQMQKDGRLTPPGPLLDENRLNQWIYDGMIGDWWNLAKGNGNVIRKS